MIKAYPKIFTIGQDYIKDIFNEDVEVTEKIDGSQFCFGRVNGELCCRSKGKQIFFDAPEKMFNEAVEFVIKNGDKINDNTVFYCEYLKKPHHNALNYERIPQNHLALFGISTIGDKFVSK
ncbi:RNA ligase family protein, partial [Patescibacteria group bacterium]|nr:RNA ligase family protein [Patescibacteria group bacterium]